MPSMPKWMNNAVENLLSAKFRAVTVIKTEYITQNVKNVRFAADLHGVECLSGYAVAFRINEEDYRKYTPYNVTLKKDVSIFFSICMAIRPEVILQRHFPLINLIKCLCQGGKKFISGILPATWL
ncbi:hypothetical protein GA0116948_11098 [Chitinophaga costaii]|uniref:Uncharacterized protein n=1 Tax=Chitinophaga costaii TaxID=1335309 RepID=A0A1C4EXX5_9BACT|nr:hypothetical protein [Chitinophaga costaii]SCC48361.1 hypothetical protein GA0116948_11098 [Chitinophaga costaii]